MFFFPLAVLVGVVGARRWRLPWAMAAGTMIFVLAVLVSWQVQGFRPTPRDLAWLGVVLVATYLSSRRRRPSPAPSAAVRQ